MPQDKSERQVAWKAAEEQANIEPTDEYGTTIARPSALDQRKVRESPVRPSEKRRLKRQLSVTFSDSAIKDRIVALTEQWGVVGPDGRRPGYSAVVEYLLLPRLEAAERGEIPSLEDTD